MPSAMQDAAPTAGARAVPVCLIAFLTVVDLFATQAILPALAAWYAASPARMGVAVNATTIGMAGASLAMAVWGHRLDRRGCIAAALVVLALPTLALSAMPALPVFAALRVAQGVCMAVAYTLALAYLAETAAPRQVGIGLAAYVTGNVASNLFGRLLSAAVADHLGIASNFQVFALLNLCGAGLVLITFRRTRAGRAGTAGLSAFLSVWRAPAVRAACAIGFCILFAFIGTFTFVNFVLAAPPFGLPMMQLGLVYFVFLPSILTTPLAGSVAPRLGTARTAGAGLAVAILGLPLLLASALPVVLAGLVAVGAGTFFAQAAMAGFVGQAAPHGRSAASGLYLGAYFLGGIAGSVILGVVFDGLGWVGCVGGIGAALVLAAGLMTRLRA